MNNGGRPSLLPRAAMTLLEVLMSVAIAGLLLVPLWSWQTTQAALQHHMRSRIQALREAAACQQLLVNDLAVTIPGVGHAGSIRLEGEHHLSLITAAAVPGHAHGFRLVTWRWSPERGLERSEGGSSRWLTKQVRLSFRQRGEGSKARWMGVWTIVDDRGQPLGAPWEMEIVR